MSLFDQITGQPAATKVRAHLWLYHKIKGVRALGGPPFLTLGEAEQVLRSHTGLPLVFKTPVGDVMKRVYVEKLNVAVTLREDGTVLSEARLPLEYGT